MAAEPSASDVRAWARDHGYDVSARGRIPADVRAAYDAAHRPARRRPAGRSAPADPQVVERLAALEAEVARLRVVKDRVVALEDQVDSLTARLAEAAGTRRRRRLRRS